MRSKETSCKAFIMFNVSFIGICVKRDSTSKLTSRSVGRSRTFCMKSVELVMCDSDFSMRDCTVCVRKRDKLYVEECMALTIGMSGIFDLLLIVLAGKDFLMLICFYWKCCFSPLGSWFCVIIFVEFLSSFLYALSKRRFFMFLL